MTNQTGYIVYATDSVGTALGEIEPGRDPPARRAPATGHVTARRAHPLRPQIRSAGPAGRRSRDQIRRAHRTATQDIVPVEHVHLHNMRSDFDERASTLDAETALPEDVVYELY